MGCPAPSRRGEFPTRAAVSSPVRTAAGPCGRHTRGWTSMAELHDLTALEQAEGIRTGQLSPVELTEHYLARMDRLDDTLGAFITRTPDLARKQAADAEGEAAAARREGRE